MSDPVNQTADEKAAADKKLLDKWIEYTKIFDDRNFTVINFYGLLPVKKGKE